MATNRSSSTRSSSRARSRSSASSKGPFGNLTVGGLIGLIVAALVLIVVLGVLISRCTKSGDGTSGQQAGSKTNTVVPVEDDPVSGCTWTARDGSELQLSADGTFVWYLDPAVHEDNYIQGTYEVYLDDAARAKITGDLSSYGITSAEIDEVLAGNLYYQNNEARLICLIINNDTVIMDGAQVGDVVSVSPTVGTYVNHDGTEALDLLNMETANDWYFTKN